MLGLGINFGKLTRCLHIVDHKGDEAGVLAGLTKNKVGGVQPG